MDLAATLDRAIPLARAAGEMIVAEFLRPDGPRGAGQTAPVDTEIEIFLRAGLRAVLPVPFRGEETAPVRDGDPRYCWVVDPNDGTSEFLRGARGSSVSIALLRDRIPVLGIVHAPLSPDRGSDLIAWAEGRARLWRNGDDVPAPPPEAALSPGAVVMLAYRSDARPATNARRVSPARFVSSNSVAYRLARVAAGDAVATVSRQSRLASHDYAAGHALLRGAGRVLVDGAGVAPTYGADGGGGMDKCFAGTEAAVAALLPRDWSLGDPPETPLAPRTALAWPRAADAALGRALGCLAGLAVGEGTAAVGLPGPGLAGALALARTLAAVGAWDPEAVVTAYRAIPGGGAPPTLLRVAPLGLWAEPELAARLASADARLTGAGDEEALACAAFAAAVATGVAGGTPEAMRAAAEAHGETSAVGPLRRGLAHLARETPVAEIAGIDPVAGALLGVAGGRSAVPPDALLALLSRRPLGTRPPALWPDDLPMLAEALLLSRPRSPAPGRGRG